MGYRRFRRPLTLVARRPSLVARRSSLGISESRHACFGEFAAYGSAVEVYAYNYLLYFAFFTEGRRLNNAMNRGDEESPT